MGMQITKEISFSRKENMMWYKRECGKVFFSSIKCRKKELRINK
jgi:hypothetical protein